MSKKAAPLLAFKKPRKRVVVLPEELIDIVFDWLIVACTPLSDAPWWELKVMDFVWSLHWTHPIKCFGNSCHSFRLRVQKLLYHGKMSIVDTRNMDSSSHLWCGLRCVDYHMLDNAKEFRFSNHGPAYQQGSRFQDCLDTLDIQSDGTRPNCLPLTPDGTLMVDENTPLVDMSDTAACNKALGHLSIESDVQAMLRFIFSRLISCHTFTWSTQFAFNTKLRGPTLAQTVAALPNLRNLRVNQSFKGGTFDLTALEHFYHLEELYLDIDQFTPRSQVKLLGVFLSKAKDLRRLTTTLASVFEDDVNVVLAATIDVFSLEPNRATRESWVLGKAVSALRPILRSQASKRVPPRVEVAEVKRLRALRMFKPLEHHFTDEVKAQRIADAFNDSMERDEAERDLARAAAELGLD